MTPLGRLTVALVAFAATVALLTGAATALEAYQMVRSLQLVQDRIAGGDHAALPMQRKLLEMIDARLRNAEAPEFEDKRNIEAMLVYGMSGGNPVTVDVVLSRLPAKQSDMALAKGIADYLRGDLGAAMYTLEDIDPMTLPQELGAFVALVKGSIIAAEDHGTAIKLFDAARLLGPGTLVEEAALRRSLPTAVKLGDTGRFLQAASQYVRRFLRSPYATQFADELVKGIVALHKTLDLESIERTVAEMTDEHQKVIYLRLARTSAIEGLQELSDFASHKAATFEAAPAGGQDARAMLYSSLSSVTSETADAILAKLRSIDRARLTEPDRKLLDAALSISQSVVSVPDTVVEVPAPPTLPPLETGAAPDTTAQSHEPAIVTPPVVVTPPPRSTKTPDRTVEPSVAFINDTRKKLEAIDKMLAESK